MTTVFEYATRADRDTVHLIRQDDLATADLAGPGLKTVCGQEVRLYLWSLGDETISGVAATCERCRRAARKAAS